MVTGTRLYVIHVHYIYIACLVENLSRHYLHNCSTPNVCQYGYSNVI